MNHTDVFTKDQGSGWEIFKDATKEHSDRLQKEDSKEDPVEKFKDILSTLIAQSKVKLDGKNNSDSIMGRVVWAS